jgi:hypothetical protein
MTKADELPWNATTRQCREFALNKLLKSDDHGRRDQIISMLGKEPRERVGEFAIFCVQSDALCLKPWVLPPIGFEAFEGSKHNETPGDAEMRALVARMKQLRVSIAHPDPARAVEQAEAAHAPRS